MSITAAQVKVEYTADTAGLKKGQDDVNQSVEKGGGILSTFLGTLGGFVGGAAVIGVATTAFSFLKDTITDSIGAANALDGAQAQLKSTLQSTNDASGMTLKGLNDLADGLARTTTYSAVATEGAEKILLTFTNIGKDTFPAATQAAQNLAARMGMDLNSAALLVGKALNDPVKGMAALHREGVDLSAAQQEQVKHFMAVGDAADAQKIILGELNKEMGGAATAAGSTLGGQLQILSNQMDQAKEKIGEALIPMFTGLLGAVLPVINGLSGVGAKVLPVLSGFIGDMLALGQDIGDTIGHLTGLGSALSGVQDPAKTLGDIGKKLADALNTVDYWANTAWAGFSKGVGPLGDLHLAFNNLQNVVSRDIMPTLQTLWGVFKDDILPIFGTLWDVLKTDVFPALLNVWDSVEAKLIPSVQRLWDKLSPVLIPALQLAGTILKDTLGPALQVVGWILGNVVGPALGGVIDFISKMIDAVTWLITKIGDLLGFLGNMGTAVQNFQKSGVGQVLGKVIPGFATGGTMAETGLAIVGERGPELVTLPGGAQVSPLPTGVPSPGGSSGYAPQQPTQQTIILQLDGRTLTQAVLKNMPVQVRLATGNHSV